MSAHFEAKAVVSAQCPKTGRIFQLSFRGLLGCEALEDGLKRAFVGTKGHTSIDTQRQGYRDVKDFCRFLKSKNEPLSKFPKDCLQGYRAWLEQRASSCRMSRLNTIKDVLAWCQRNVPSIVQARLTLAVPRFPKREPARPVVPLSAEEIKRILAVCYRVIEQQEARWANGFRMVRQMCDTETERVQSRLILELLKFGRGELPLYSELRLSGGSFRQAIREFGGYRLVAKTLCVDHEALLPYYLAILIQTSGNPDCLRLLQRDCIRPHPLRSDLERMVWTKWRSKSEQRADFPTGRYWSAPSLVRRLAGWNDDLAPLAPLNDRDRLFIARSLQSRQVGVPSASGMHLLLKSFIRREGLPQFDLRSLRRAGAVAHHQAGQSIEAARVRLGHKSVETTARYSPLSTLKNAHDAVIRRYQGELVLRSFQGSAEPNEPPTTIGREMETVFGFRCRDPFAGTAPKSVAGKMCLNFSACATCPGALIPLDDIQVVAKLLATKRALEAARESSLIEGWRERFDVVYAATLNVISCDLLPLVIDGILAQAKRLENQFLLPRLE